MAQKVIKIGSSVGITLSPELLAQVGLKVGDTVHVSGGQHEILLRPVAAKPKVERELVDWIEDAIERYRPALEALADK